MDLGIPKNIVLPEAPLDDSWTAPLDAVARAIEGVRQYRHFDLGDFMIMHRVLRKPRADVTCYKHYWIRRYLNLDQAGHPYKYVPVRGPDGHWASGRYVPYKDLRRALDHLDRWDLPWMKPGLEPERHGLSVADRWVLHPEELDGRTEEVAAAEWLAEKARWEQERRSWSYGEGV